jgi:hypothetical protein
VNGRCCRHHDEFILGANGRTEGQWRERNNIDKDRNRIVEIAKGKEKNVNRE